MKIKNVEISNFLSIENASIDFEDTGLLLVDGWNYDVDRANGAGKTAILNAVSFALYDKLPRKISASEILRRGTKKGFVKVQLESGNETYIVTRSRPKGVTFSHLNNGVEEQLSITQDEWENKLKLNYNQFIISMYCAQGSQSRFLMLNDADKKTFLLQLLDLKEFQECKGRADNKIKAITDEVTSLNNQVNILTTKIDAYSESLIDVENCSTIVEQKNNLLRTLEQQLTENSLVPKPDLSKFQKLEEDLLVKKSELVKLRAKREMLHTQWLTLNRKIKPFNAADACYACGAKLDNSEARLIHQKEVSSIKEEQLTIKNQLDTLDIELLRESKLNELHSKLKDKKKKESTDYERACIIKVELNSKIANIKREITELKVKIANDSDLRSKIDSLKMRKEELAAKIALLSKDLELYRTIANIYSPTGAQAYVLDSAVNLFNEQINKYVSMLWSNLTYELQSYKETVKGDVTAKFSESIIMDGKPISLGSLSGGELKALSICTDLALLGILENQFGIYMSPIIFDEPFDGLDAPGKEFTLDLLHTLSQDRQIVVIDHQNEIKSIFSKVLRVEKRNGVSTVSVQP